MHKPMCKKLINNGTTTKTNINAYDLVHVIQVVEIFMVVDFVAYQYPVLHMNLVLKGRLDEINNHITPQSHPK